MMVIVVDVLLVDVDREMRIETGKLAERRKLER
jgi:hypothetical protein